MERTVSSPAHCTWRNINTLAADNLSVEPGIPVSESFAGVFTLFNNELHTKAPELSYKTRQQAALKVCWYSCKSSSSFFNSPRLLSSNYFSDCILGFLPQSYLKMLSDEFEIGTLLQLLV